LARSFDVLGGHGATDVPALSDLCERWAAAADRVSIDASDVCVVFFWPGLTSFAFGFAEFPEPSETCLSGFDARKFARRSVGERVENLLAFQEAFGSHCERDFLERA
jgi:hypothetical protein